jgi:hypothetical protein
MDVFDHSSRQIHFNRALAKFHQRVAAIICEIDYDISSRGFGALSNHPRVQEILLSAKDVADEMMTFDSRHAQFLKDRAAAGGGRADSNPFAEKNGREVCEWIEADVSRLPRRIRHESKKLSLPDEGSWGERTKIVADEINYGVRQFYAEQRTLFELFRKNGPVASLGVFANDRTPDSRLLEDNAMPRRKGKIFIGHGGSKTWKDLKDFLSERLHIDWQEFNRESAAGMSTVERLESMLNDTSFAFLVMTAEDDHADGTKHARENVIHEIGLFQGRHGFKRAIILLETGCEEFSNIVGLVQIRFEKGKIDACFEKVRQVLEREGMIGDQSGGKSASGAPDIGSRMTGLSVPAVRYFMTLSRPRNRVGVPLDHFDRFPNRDSETYRAFMDAFVQRGLVRRGSGVFLLTKNGYDEADSLWRLFLLSAIQPLQSGDPLKYADSSEIAIAARLTDGPLEQQALNGHLTTLAQLGLVETSPIDGGVGGARLTQQGRDHLRSLEFIDFPPPD